MWDSFFSQIILHYYQLRHPFLFSLLWYFATVLQETYKSSLKVNEMDKSAFACKMEDCQRSIFPDTPPHCHCCWQAVGFVGANWFLFDFLAAWSLQQKALKWFNSFRVRHSWIQESIQILTVACVLALLHTEVVDAGIHCLSLKLVTSKWKTNAWKQERRSCGDSGAQQQLCIYILLWLHNHCYKFQEIATIKYQLFAVIADQTLFHWSVWQNARLVQFPAWNS